MELCVSSNYQRTIEPSASIHYSYLFYNVRWNPPLCIACIFFTIKNKALRFFGSLRSYFKIVRLSSPIFHLGWKVFYRVDCSIFLLYLPFELGGFSLNQLGQISTNLLYQSSVFLSYLPSGLGGFLPNTLGIFRFFSLISPWVKRFFIDQSHIFFIVLLGLET